MDLSKYDIIFLIAGGNNFYTRDGDFKMHASTLQQCLLDLENLICQQSPTTRLVTTEIFPRNWNGPCNNPGVHKKHCVQASLINGKHRFDIRLPELWRSRRHANPRYFVRDGVHLNFEGKDVLCSKWVSYLQSI